MTPYPPSKVGDERDVKGKIKGLSLLDRDVVSSNQVLEMDIDTSEWEIAVELPHGALYWVEPGIVAAIPDDGVVETPYQSKLVYDGYCQCAKTFGSPIGIIVFVDRLKDQTPEVREFWAEVMQPEVLCAVAMVCRSFFSRAVATFFMGIRRPIIPMQLFATFDQALGWAHQRVELQQADERAV